MTGYVNDRNLTHDLAFSSFRSFHSAEDFLNLHFLVDLSVTSSRGCSLRLVITAIAKHLTHQQVVTSRSFNGRTQFRLIPSQFSRDQYPRSFTPLTRFLFRSYPKRLRTRRSRESRFSFLPPSILFTRRFTDDSQRYAEVSWIFENC